MRYNYTSGITKEQNTSMLAAVMAIASAGLIVMVGLVQSASAVTPAATYTEYPFTTSEVADNWSIDRSLPSGGYGSVAFGSRSNVLEMNIVTGDRSTVGSFYYTEGLKRDANDSDTVRADLYVDSTWLNNKVRAGIWGVGNDEAGTITAYPIVEFTTAGDGDFTGWRIFNDRIGGWTNLRTVPYNINGWNKLEISYNTSNTKYDFYVNEALVGRSAATGSKVLDEVILNSYNYGSLGNDYSVHWSNLALGEYATTKDHCKDGKWAVFTDQTFKNQGACVSSVSANGNASFKREQ